VVNQDADKIEMKKKSKQKAKMTVDEKGNYLIDILNLIPLFSDSDVIVHGYIKKLGGPFTSAWQTKYGKLYPSRFEIYPESLNGKPEVSIQPLNCLTHIFSSYSWTKLKKSRRICSRWKAKTQ
jgi:beta-adrenergic-receptor kinase